MYNKFIDIYICKFLYICYIYNINEVFFGDNTLS